MKRLDETYRINCLRKLEGIRQVFLGLKMLYCCTIPSDEFEICNKYFHFLNIETRKLILGKLYVLLADDFKGKRSKYNTISFKILIENILDKMQDHNNEKLNEILCKINDVDERHKIFRDKFYAHIELNNDETLKSVVDLNITTKDITDLIQLSEDAYDCLLLLLDNASSDHMKEPIDCLSSKLWKSYIEVGLVRKI